MTLQSSEERTPEQLAAIDAAFNATIPANIFKRFRIFETEEDAVAAVGRRLPNLRPPFDGEDYVLAKLRRHMRGLQPKPVR